mgnify:CR=1 FL=1
MTPALMALIIALFSGSPVTVPMVETAGGSVAVVEALPDPAWTGWIGCAESACDIRLVRADSLRHEAAHAADYLCDGALDGSICGWQPWAGSGEEWRGPVEALGSTLGRTP